MRRLMHSRQAKAWTAWAEFAAERGARLLLLRRSVLHGLLRCLEAWRAAAAKTDGELQTMRRAAAFLALRHLVRAWRAWAEAAEARAAARDLARGCVQRMRQRRLTQVRDTMPQPLP